MEISGSDKVYKVNWDAQNYIIVTTYRTFIN
jgi:hypothetical protein